jgi:APA family basic amino acid/polyamine antiporter
MKTNDPEPIEPIPSRLGLWDAVSIIIGIVVGTAIFRTSSSVFANSSSPQQALGLWLFGGVLSWCGAVCYAELATTYPRDGGDYVYLTRAFGPWCGFLFGWAQLTIILSGNIAIMAYAFADYSMRLWPDAKPYAVWITMAPIVVLSLVNAAGIVLGKSAQNALTVTKVIGIAALVLVGLFSSAAPSVAPDLIDDGHIASLGLALVFVLYAYGGWNHAAYVAAEVRDQGRNLPRALFLGLGCITAIYLVVNLTYLKVLGFADARATSTPAADVMELALGAWGSRAISVLVMLSALSAINGMILTGSRIYAVWGADYTALSWLSGWNRRTDAPVAAIAVQAIVALLLIMLVGTDVGRDAFDAALHLVALEPLPWDQYFGGFETLIAGSAPVYWGLCLLTGFAVFVLRFTDRTIERPFRIPIYPVPAIVFCISCLFMLVASLRYARWLTLIGIAPLILGIAVWLAIGSSRRGNLE